MPDNGNLAGLLADHGTRTDMRVLRDDRTADDRAALDKHAAGEPMAKLKALKARHDLSTDVTRFD